MIQKSMNVRCSNIVASETLQSCHARVKKNLVQALFEGTKGGFCALQNCPATGRRIAPLQPFRETIIQNAFR